MKLPASQRVLALYNRDYEGSNADPENRAREEVREVATEVVRALAARGVDASALGVSNDVADVLSAVRAVSPAVVFNLCESIGSDNRFEPLLPLLLELEGVAYTGSGPFALGLALHKHKAKEVLRGCGVATPRSLSVFAPGALADPAQVDLRFPVIVKPTREDASVGVTAESVVSEPGALAARVDSTVTRYRQPALVEEFITGRELNVSVLADSAGQPRVLPLFEIDFSDMPAGCPHIVSFDGKWVESSAEYAGSRPVPCDHMDPVLRQRVSEAALGAFRALELRDYGRVDVRLGPDGVPYVIDVNPNCDLSRHAGFARAAQAGGYGYEDLIAHLVTLASARDVDADPTISAVGSAGPRAFATRPERAGGAAQPAAGDVGAFAASGPTVSRRGSGLRARAPRSRA